MKSTSLLLTLLCLLLAVQPVLAQAPAYTLQQTLQAPSDIMSGGRYGSSSALDGNRLVLGSTGDSTVANVGGGVKIFDATTGALQMTISSPVAQSSQEFGSSVILQGDRLIIAARRTHGTKIAQGSVYVYDLASATPTVPVLSIPNPEPSDNDFFGAAVALSGNRLVVGANNNDTGATDSGRVYVYDLAGATPTVHTLAINNPTPGASDSFGISLALEGNTLVVSSTGDDTGATNAGIAYVFDLGSGTPSTPVHTINNPDPLANENFGGSITLSGSLVGIASSTNMVSGVAAGSVHLYDLSSGTPTVPVHTIDNPTPQANDFFGSAMTLQSTRLVVTASRDYFNGAQTGSAYVYDLASGTPTVPVHTLNNPAPATQDFFGTSVALSGNRILIGASQDDLAAPNSGAGYFYNLSSATPTVPVLTLAHTTAAADNHFGQAVAVSGSLVAVGLPDDDLVGIDAGTVAVYDMNSATPGTPVLIIDNLLTDINSRIGASIALEGTRLVVGAPNAFTPSIRAGLAYVFDLSSATPKVPVLTMLNPTPVASDNFGSSVTLSGSLIVVGAPEDDTGASNAGSAYVYDMNSATPDVPVHTLINPSPSAGDEFGVSVAISGQNVIVGARGDGTGAASTGIAYVFNLGGATPTMPVHVLTNPTPTNSEQFGSAVTIDGNRIVVAAKSASVGAIARAGSIYEYDLASATPTTPVRTIDHPSPTFNDAFGASLSLAGSRVVVGVSGNDTGATDAGRVYVFDLASATPASPLAILNNPTPSQADAFGTAVSIQGSRITVGIPNSDANGRDQGAVAVFGPPSTNADLSALTLSNGTLTPDFASATTTYTAAIPPGTSSMTVTPTKAQSGATITVNGNAVTSGNASGSIALSLGDNPITIVVTAEDTVTTKTYSITANVPGSGTLAFASPVFTVASSAAGSMADIVIQRSVSIVGPVSCTLSSADGSAIAPTHYTAQSNAAVSFGDGISEQHLMLPIVANATTTTAKVFTISLGNGSIGATLGSPSTATVVILPPASATELIKPIATFTAPANAATIVDTLPVVISGTATDNIGVAKVQLSLNNGAFSDVAIAAPGATSTTFTTNVTPAPGLNSVRIRTLDFKGNASTIVTRTFTHLRTLTVSVSGPANSGVVTAGFVPTSNRQVGKSYTIVATPKPGFVFDGWTVNNTTNTGITPLKMELPTLAFIMQPGLTLTAKFIVNPFTSAVTGDFSGLITASSSQPSGGTVMSNSTTGLCTAKLTTAGTLTGSIKIDGLTLPIVATCDNTGVARFGVTRETTIKLLRPGKPWLVLALTADLSGATNRITGTLTELKLNAIVAQSDIKADRHHFNGTTSIVPATYVKSYTARLKARTSQGVGFTTHDYPQGDGYLTFKVLANGSVSMSGKLADDTVVTMSGNLSQAKHWPIFQSLYLNKGCIAADAVLDDTQADTDATAMNMLWFRPFQVVQWYPYGWDEGIYIDMLASKYTPSPATVFPGLNVTNSTTGNTDLTFTDGLLTSSVTKFVNLTTTNVLTKAPTTDATFTFVPVFTTGLISGTFKHSDNTTPKWQGVLMQKGANKGGHGYFMSSKPAVLNYIGESGAMHWLAK